MAPSASSATAVESASAFWYALVSSRMKVPKVRLATTMGGTEAKATRPSRQLIATIAPVVRHTCKQPRRRSRSGAGGCARELVAAGGDGPGVRPSQGMVP